MVLDTYNRLDVTATMTVADDLQVVLSLDNLLDEDYAEAIGFPSPGLRGRLGIRYQF